MQFWIDTQLVNRYGALFIWLVRIHRQFVFICIWGLVYVSEDACAPPLRHSPLKPWAYCAPRARGRASFCFGGREPGPSHYGYLRCIEAMREHVTWHLQQLLCFDTIALYVSRIALLFAGRGTAEPTHFDALLSHQETAAGKEIVDEHHSLTWNTLLPQWENCAKLRWVAEARLAETAWCEKPKVHLLHLKSLSHKIFKSTTWYKSLKVLQPNSVQKTIIIHWMRHLNKFGCAAAVREVWYMIKISFL